MLTDGARRRTRRRGRVVGIAALLPFAGGWSDARAEGSPLGAWRPSISIGALVQAQDAKGKAVNTFAARPAFDPNVSGNPAVVVPAIPVGVQLDAPTLHVRGRALRPFAHARLQFPMDPDRTIARQGSLPKPVVLPVDPSDSLTADALSGQGTLFIATLDLTAQAGIGLSTELPLPDLPVQLGVSLDYLAQRISFDGLVVRVEGAGPGDTEPFTERRLRELDQAVFHHLGPRFELETEIGRRGPIDITVFLDFGAFFAVGDRSKSFRATDGPDSADFDFRIKPWLIQAGAGLRLAFVGLE